MPRKEIDYSKTIIYKICCRDVNIKDCYVGHTTNFKNRKNQHKKNYNNEKIKTYVYQFIREHNGWGNFDMIEIEKVDCKDFNDACKRERYWIETLSATLNKVIPTRTDKEYYNDNKQKYKKYREENKQMLSDKKKVYYQDNKERLNNYHKEWYEKNKDKELEKTKKYYNENKQIRLDYAKKYREENKDKVNEKIECDCGVIIYKRYLSTHKKSKKHLAYIQNNS